MRDFSFNFSLFADVTQMPFSVACLPFCKIYFPHGEIRVPGLVEKRPANMLAENAAVMRRRLVFRECHFSFVQQKMLSNAGLEITVAVRADPNNSQLCSLMTAALSLFVKEVNRVAW